jgi:hypothetical protein
MASKNKYEFIQKQIKAVSKLLMNVLFKTEDYQYKVSSSENQTEFDKLYLTLMDMLEKNQINEAEDMLFDQVDGMNPIILIIALNFYNKLTTKTEEELESANFSVDEVEQGFLDLLRMYNVKVDKKQ